MVEKQSWFREHSDMLGTLALVYVVGLLMLIAVFRVASCQEKRDARINQIVVLP